MDQVLVVEPVPNRPVPPRGYKRWYNGGMDTPVLRRITAYVPPSLNDDLAAASERTGLSASRIIGDALSAYVRLHKGMPGRDDEPPFVPLQLHLTADQHRAVSALSELSGSDPSRIVGLVLDTALKLRTATHVCRCAGSKAA